MGTASTMQIMAEALGLMLPGTALLPAMCEDLRDGGGASGQASHVAWPKMSLRPHDMVTMESFENAIMVHAAISGSTNALLHIPAIAHEFGIDIGRGYLRPDAPRRALSARHPAGGTLAGAVFLLRRRRAAHHGGDQVHAASGRR